jgi:hypothetical protein
LRLSSGLKYAQNPEKKKFIFLWNLFAIGILILKQKQEGGAPLKREANETTQKFKKFAYLLPLLSNLYENPNHPGLFAGRHYF